MSAPAPAAGPLARRIYDRSHLTGEFRLRSGATSGEYFDKYLFESDPELLREIAQALVELLPEQADAVAGLELGGVPLATVVSQLSGLPALFVRKQAKTYGTCRLAEGGEIAGRRLAVIEDVIRTGGQVVESYDDPGPRPICSLGDRDAFGDSADLCESHVRLSSEDVECGPRFSCVTDCIALPLARVCRPAARSSDLPDGLPLCPAEDGPGLQHKARPPSQAPGPSAGSRCGRDETRKEAGSFRLRHSLFTVPERGSELGRREPYRP